MFSKRKKKDLRKPTSIYDTYNMSVTHIIPLFGYYNYTYNSTFTIERDWDIVAKWSEREKINKNQNIPGSPSGLGNLKMIVLVAQGIAM